MHGMNVEVKYAMDAGGAAGELAADGFNFARILQYWNVALEPTAPTMHGSELVHA